MVLDEKDFLLFRSFIYELTGIYFEESKKYLLEKRLENRMEDLGCSSVKEYYYLLKSDSRGSEVSNLINVVTTNETYFFRNMPQLKLLSEELLPKIIEKKRQLKDYTLRMWSAACSTGEEPYTLAILALENIPDSEKWLIQIFGNDINRQVLDRARKGVYGSRAVKDVHPYYMEKYFIQNGGTFEVKRDLKKLVRFSFINLIDEKQMTAMVNMDIIFCRNVLIYFDDESRKQAVNFLYDSLRHDGYIFLGHSESMSRISTAFKLVKFQNGIIYKKE